MVEIVKRVVCDWCFAPGPSALESEDPKELARAAGWSVGETGEEGEVCPECLKK